MVHMSVMHVHVKLGATRSETDININYIEQSLCLDVVAI